MNCIQFKDILFEYIDRSLGDATMKQADQHLTSCKVCSALHEEELNVSGEPLTDMMDEIHELELKEETISEISTQFMILAKSKSS